MLPAVARRRQAGALGGLARVGPHQAQRDGAEQRAIRATLDGIRRAVPNPDSLNSPTQAAWICARYIRQGRRISQRPMRALAGEAYDPAWPGRAWDNRSPHGPAVTTASTRAENTSSWE